MVKGKRQAIDSAYIKANVSLDSLVEKEVLDDVEKYSEELNENSEHKITLLKENIPHDDKASKTVTSEKKKISRAAPCMEARRIQRDART